MSNIAYMSDYLQSADAVSPEPGVPALSTPSVLDHSAYILVAVGGFIFIISFLGYCGSLQENRVLLTSYGLFLIIIFVLQVNIC